MTMKDMDKVRYLLGFLFFIFYLFVSIQGKYCVSMYPKNYNVGSFFLDAV